MSVNFENLRKHADFLKANLDLGFGMERYSDGDRSSKIPKEICGTVGCSVGYAVMWAPQDVLNRCYNDVDDELDYSLLEEELFTTGNSNAWYWLFTGEWERIDNTLDGARCRIEYYLEHKKVPLDIMSEYYDSKEFFKGKYIELMKPYRLTKG